MARAAWLVTSALLFTLLQTFFQQPVALIASVGVALFAMLSAWRPTTALLLLAALIPISGVLMALGRGEAGSIVLAEVLALAFLTGWTARRVVESGRLEVSVAVRGAAMFLSLSALASAAIYSSRTAVELYPEPPSILLYQTLNRYVLHLPGSEPVAAAVVLGCGTLLLVAAAHLTAGSPERRTAILRMFVCGATAAAAFNLARVVEITLRRGDPTLGGFVNVLMAERVNTQFADLNAAGSLFAMALLLAVALAGKARWLAVAAGPLIGVAIWITGSRFALASVAVAAVGGILAGMIGSPRRFRRLTAVAAVVMLAVVVGVTARVYPEGRNIGANKALQIRLAFADAGLRMAADNPWFGVGLGQYYVLSPSYADEALAALGFARENAHNYFVQILAELGVPGLIAFVVLLAAAFREIVIGPRSWEARWIAAGLAAFLVTCLGGHPLLVPEAAFSFWLVTGLAAAPATLAAHAPSRWRHAPAVLALVMLASIWPRATAAVRDANFEHTSIGLSKWQHAPDGMRYRFAGGRSEFYIPSTARAVRIPFMNAADDRLTVEAEIRLEGREVNRVMLPADDRWRVARIVLLRESDEAFLRVELLVRRPGEPETVPIDATDTGGAIRVGRPEVER